MYKFLLTILFLFAFTGCATLGDLIEGDFETAEQCRIATDEEIAELELTEGKAESLKSEIYKLCDRHADIMRAREDVRDAVQVFKVFL